MEKPNPPKRDAQRFDGLLLTILLLAAFLPTLIADIPALTDYPAHLARMSILMRDGTPEAYPYYEVVWAPYPNLAMDLIVPLAGRVIGIELASRLFYLVAQALVVSGAMAIAWAARGPCFLSGFVATLFLYAMPLAFGFVNFEFALGVSLWAIAVWIRYADKALPVRLAIHTAFVAVLYISHLFGLGIYGVVVGLYELSHWGKHIQNRRYAIQLFAGMAIPAIAVGALAYTFGGKIGGTGTEWVLSAKLFGLFQVNGFSKITSSAVTTAMIILGYLAVKHKRLNLSRAGWWIASGLLGLYLLMPFRLADTAFVDGRVLLALVLILPAFTTITRPGSRLGWAFTILLAGFGLANSGVAIWSQWSYRSEYRALMAAFERIASGSRILTGLDGPRENPPSDLLLYPMYNAATLAVLTRDALVPTLFAYPGKQPLRPRPEIARLTVPQGEPIPMSELDAYAAGAVPPPEGAYAAFWTHDFDYLLVIGPQNEERTRKGLELVGAGERFSFYRIAKPGS